MPKVNLSEYLSSPNADSSIELQVDWLELFAFYHEAHVALLQTLVSGFEIAEERESDDIGSADAEAEAHIGAIVSEIERRIFEMDGAYPFKLSDNGLQLILSDEWNVGQAVYLLALVLSHTPRSEIVPEVMAPIANSLRDARELFQVSSTLAAAGHCKGPAFSMGWPRPDKSTFLNKLKEIWAFYGDGVPHDEPPDGTPTAIKDEGIDIFAWWPEKDKQPGIGYLVGQVASGHDWPYKSVKPHVDLLVGEWFSKQPVTNAHPAIFIPFALQPEKIRRTYLSHGYIFHRNRLSKYAQHAPQLAAEGIGPIERLDDAQGISKWLNVHVDAVSERVGK